MSTGVESAASPGLSAGASGSRRAVMLRKLHSLTGVLPLGVFLLVHLWTNAKALQGQDRFERAVLDLQALPLLPGIEIVTIFLPLAYHALYGVYLALYAKPDPLVYPSSRSWLYTVQRVTGLFAVAFIGWHLYEYRIHAWLLGMRAESFYNALSLHLSSTTLSIPWLAVVYLLGLAAVVLHFANGLWTSCVRWGFAVSRSAQRRTAYACAVLGIVMFAIGGNTVLYFATGSRLFPRSGLVPLKGEVGDGPCPAPQ